ncbi:MAG: endoribonuclease [Acidimicrobiales bacterium]|nr:endoribonuclease [Acidimicrobiales bacterium]
MEITARLEELGIVLPDAMPPAGSYVPMARHGDLVYVSGHGPVDGERMVCGKVGRDLDVDAARAAARLTGLSILATLQAGLGDLDAVVQVVKVLGMVNAAPGFDQLPAVVDGCSDLLVEVFGDRGRHARSAVGMAELPFGIAVEVELIAQVRPA